MRSLLLYLSRQKALRRWMETAAAARPLSSRFVAGIKLEDAMKAARSVNAQNMSASLDYLGENVTSLDQALACQAVYLKVLRDINSAGLNANVSLKLTQFGIGISEGACRENVRKVAVLAAQFRSFVRIDMEGSELTERTLEIVKDLHAETGACGAVIQAYLKRSLGDVEALNGRRIRVRLCKGAYLEPPAVALADKHEVDANFLVLARKLLAEGNYPGIATHDEKMISGTLEFVKERKIPAERFEFQMLYGVRRDLQKRLVAEGWRVRVYIPFGEAWYPYFMRRLAERPANLLFVAKALVRG
ncbi:MAG: proline dehydrogenase family protein [Acidobacteriota bacterium]|nr:proline dehydrogenase family protein [Acidobacteriota bacterium]